MLHTLSDRHNRRLVQQQTASDLHCIFEQALVSRNKVSDILFEHEDQNHSIAQESLEMTIDGFVDDKIGIIFDENPFISSNDELPEESLRDSDKVGLLNESNNSEESITNETFLSAFTAWIREFKPSASSVNALLRILRKHANPNFPKDCRTLLKTPTYTKLHTMCKGQYWHNGLEKVVLSIIKKRMQIDHGEDKDINLLINIDGATIGKSSGKSMWPILCTNTICKQVHVIGIYYGEDKPDNSNILLDRFINEAVVLINNGILFNNNMYNVKIKGLICDAPAKAYILRVKYHSGFDSCTKCIIEGKRVENTVCFPGVENQTLRTDELFQQYAYSLDYQTGETNLVCIPHLGLVSNVVLDYMHLVCLGGMRKLMYLWISGPINVRLSTNDVNKISQLLINLRKSMPSDFCRKPRALKFLKLWKATEFRLFLLYLGPIVLPKILRKELYEHFLTLHTAITILASPVLCTDVANIAYAEQLLKYFVRDFEVIYGQKYMSHNIHNLLHLAADVRQYGYLDGFSAFPFENFIGKLTKLIRKSERPLQQIARRLSEYEVPSCNIPKSNLCTFEKQHHDGPFDNNEHYTKQYKIMRKSNYFINCDSEANCCCLLNNNIMIEGVNFAVRNNISYVIGMQLMPVDNLYLLPTESSELGIKVVKKKEQLQSWPCDTIRFKLMKVTYHNNKLVVFPILHTAI